MNKRVLVNKLIEVVEMIAEITVISLGSCAQESPGSTNHSADKTDKGKDEVCERCYLDDEHKVRCQSQGGYSH